MVWWILGALALLFMGLETWALMRASANRERAWEALSEEEVPL